MADRRLAALHHRHALTLLAMPTDRRVDRTTSNDHADDDRLVDAADATRLQLLDQPGLRLQRLGHDHQTGGVLVQAMNDARSEEHTSELQSLMRISYAVFCLKKKKQLIRRINTIELTQQTRIHTYH